LRQRIVARSLHNTCHGFMIARIAPYLSPSPEAYAVGIES
jgi:hypothetical protein